MSWRRISSSRSSPTVTNLNTIVTNPNPNWWWLTVIANGPIPYCKSNLIFLAECLTKRSGQFIDNTKFI